MSKKRGKKLQLKTPSAPSPPESEPAAKAERAPSATPAAIVKAPRTAPEIPVYNNLWRKILYWCLSAAFVILPLSLAPGNLNPYNKAFYLVVFAAAAGLVVLTVAISRRTIMLVYTPFFAAVGLWLLAKLITTFTSMSVTKSFWGAYNSWSDGFVYGLATAIILVVILTLQLEHTRIARLINLMAAQAAVVAGITLWQAYKAGFFYQKVRPDSPLLNADFFLSYALLLFPVVIILLVWHLHGRRWLATAAFGVVAIILSGAIFVTIPTHLQTLILPAFMNGKKDTTYGATDEKSISATNFTQTNANLERWTEWKIGLTLGARHPLVGTGPGTTGQAFIANKSHLDLPGWDNSHVMTRSHNDLIEQFSQEGLLGLAAYLALWLTLAWILFRNWRFIEAPNRPYAWGLLAGLTCWFGFNLLLFTTVVAGAIVWLWIALLLTMVHAARPVELPRFQVAGRSLLVGASLVMAVVSIWVWHYYRADIAFANAMAITAELNNGAFQNYSSNDRVNVRLRVDSEVTSVADSVPFEDYYTNQAALTSIDTYFAVNFTNPADAKQRTDAALKYAQAAVKSDPNSPQNLQNLGGIEYYLAPAGSPAEKAGLAIVDRAIALTPNSVAWYINAARIAALKKDYTLADSYIARGLARTLKDSDHTQLKNLKASFDKAQKEPKSS